MGYHIDFIHHSGFFVMKEMGSVSIHLLLLRLGKHLVYTSAKTEHVMTM